MTISMNPPSVITDASDVLRVTLHTRAAALAFMPKMRVGIERDLRWYQRLWRWLLKRNWRVRDVDYKTLVVTLERCR